MKKILGVRVDNLSRKEILEKISVFLSEPSFHQIATVGPEFVLLAEKDEKFRDILNSSDLNVADGVGIWFVFLRHFKFLKARFAGADLMMKILKMAENRGLGVFLACRKDGLSSWEETRDAILKKFPKLKIDGVNLDCHSERSEEPQFVKNNLNNKGSFAVALDDILFCNFGAPYQEYFINSLKGGKIRLARLGSTRLAMGVGGSFDFLTGKVRRAPKIMRLFGFEWLWRLLQQPKRWKRIWNAVIIFPIKIIINR